MKQQWHNLLGQLDVLEYGREILSSNKIIEFENSTKILLPQSYKEFCEVFGTGLFGNFVGIVSPSLDFFEYGKTIIFRINEEVEMFPSKDREWDRGVKSILDSAFIFGGNSVWEYIAFWDLRTYQKSDRSYDIYWMSTSFSGSEDDETFYIGRDFFEFVVDFCLGTKVFEILPFSKQPPPECIYQTFTRSSWS